MKLEGIHHVTAITADAPGNVQFYTGVLGLRLVKKSVNQDDPTVYHLFYGDEEGSPGADLTFFEYPDAARGRAGAGMVHRVVWRLGSAEALEFWQERLSARGTEVRREGDGLVFADPEGLAHELLVSASADPPLRAQAPDIPPEHALLGFSGVRAYSAEPARSSDLLRDTLGFRGGETDGRWELRGEQRGSFYAYDAPPPGAPASQGAGTVHHVAFAAQPQDEEAWRARVTAVGMHATEVIERFYFRSVYFREPGGILYEIADHGPGFTRGQTHETMGQKVILPPWLEGDREAIEARLTPIGDPRATWATA